MLSKGCSIRLTSSGKFGQQAASRWYPKLVADQLSESGVTGAAKYNNITNHVRLCPILSRANNAKLGMWGKVEGSW